MGHLTRDPELRRTSTGTGVCEMSIAVNNKYKTKDGKDVDDVCFVSVTTWGPKAEACAENLCKGACVMVDGELKYNKWENKEGQKRNKLTVNARSVQFITRPKVEEAEEQEAEKSDTVSDGMPF